MDMFPRTSTAQKWRLISFRIPRGGLDVLPILSCQVDDVYLRTEHILRAMIPLPPNGSGIDSGGGSRTGLEADIASACPELTEAQVSKVRSAMAEAKRINPKNRPADYRAALMTVFPDPAVKKSVYTRTKGLLPRA